MALPIHKLIEPNSPSPAPFTVLPGELLNEIVSYLPNRDIKSLRQTCRLLHSVAHLRLSRVFLSANPRDVEVFRAIADHETFRKEIVEIIYDDARLASPPILADMGTYGYESDESWEGEESFLVTGAPLWFARICRDNAFNLNARRICDADTPDHVARSRQLKARMNFRQSWEHYQRLLLQQNDALYSRDHIRALQYGLTRFPELRRIVVTPAAHGFLYTPLYETPMIRALPYGFNYPIPRGWPCVDDGEAPPKAREWDDEMYKSNWQGFRDVLRELARQDHHVSELLIDACYLQTGVNCRIFDQPCDEYNDLIAVLRKPGFRRLDLDLLVGGQEHLGWCSFRHGFLRRALAEAKDLEHMSLRTDVRHDPDARATVRGSAGRIEHAVPLRTVFPVEEWPRLRHFGLNNFLVTQEDVMGLLALLPPTIRTVELSFLGFLDNGGSYKTLLEAMRDTLGWRDRDEWERPKVAISVEMVPQECSGRAIWLESEVDDFLYRGGGNPFGRGMCGDNQIAEGRGTVRDAFDPAFERPWVSYQTYQALGIYK